MAKVVHGYCPVCKKVVPDSQVYPVVVMVDSHGDEVINRAFHFPGCKGYGELEPREFDETSEADRGGIE